VGAPDVRFGGMKMRFAATDAATAAESEAKGTRAIASVERPRKPAAAPAPAPAAAPDSAARNGVPVIVWVLLVVVAVAAYLLLQGRA
jgi:hypothetical protein